MAQNKKIRSQVEMNNPDLNYFIAFKINTKETDVTKIKDALTKKRNTFAAQQTVINYIKKLNNFLNKVLHIKRQPVLNVKYHLKSLKKLITT